MEGIEIGQRIAALRKQHSLSQRELAERAEMTNSAISAIENNKVSPSVSSLQKIVNVFSLSMAEFFARQQPESQVVIPPEQLIELGANGVSMKLASSPSGELGFLIEQFQPNTSTGQKHIKHEGVEVGTVLEGEVELQLGDERFLLKQGESFTFDSSIPHRFTNRSDGICRLISAHTPASF